jgi:hypothetical protein
MYVDDIFGVCLLKNVELDMKTAKGICEDLLGTGAVEDAKSRVGERLDVIGYTVDLSQQLVTVAEKNVLRAIYGFSVTGENGTVTVYRNAEVGLVGVALQYDLRKDETIRQSALSLVLWATPSRPVCSSR